MSKRVIQIDNYDEIELWAAGACILRLRWDHETQTLTELSSGPMSLSNEPGIIRALRESLHEEGL